MMPNRDTLAERYAIALLRTMDAAGLRYHNMRHSLDVRKYSLRLCDKMGIGGRRRRLMQIAALYHDLGYIVQYRENEPYGTRIAETSLGRLSFPASEVAFVKRMIMATRMPQRPKDIYERIICDADLSNLGQRSFWRLSRSLREELGIKSDSEWIASQISFLSGHAYHTATARKELEPIKQQHLRILKDMASGRRRASVAGLY